MHEHVWVYTFCCINYLVQSTNERSERARRLESNFWNADIDTRNDLEVEEMKCQDRGESDTEGLYHDQMSSNHAHSRAIP